MPCLTWWERRRDWNDQPESRLSGHFTRAGSHLPQRRYVVCEATAEPAWSMAAPRLRRRLRLGIEREHFVGAAKGTLAPSTAHRQDPDPDPRHGHLHLNHDIFAGPRLWDQVAGDEAAYKLAATAYLLGPGTPYIYYGEGNRHGWRLGPAGRDGPIRSPMSWDNEQPFAGFLHPPALPPGSPNRATHHSGRPDERPCSIWHHYRRLSHLRQAEPALRSGALGDAPGRRPAGHAAPGARGPRPGRVGADQRRRSACQLDAQAPAAGSAKTGPAARPSP